MDNVQQLPVQATTSRPAPKRIVRPCEWGLRGSVRDLETQLGTVEAYNRLCDAAAVLKAKIDAGNAEAQNRLFATDPNWIYPVGHHD
ncbi:hypothetical protein [Nevskia soli]|uniref:hypothetical protein n=1 Tax=Nevskia soli TaxID=418856 RepID=UPI0015D83B8F|nr:hypothetical protein [Nevskia soli]